jgi:hypothetical protein
VEFATFRKSRGNAQILYKAGDGGKILAGQIDDIFVHQHPGGNGDTVGKVFVTVQQYEELSQGETKFDPY